MLPIGDPAVLWRHTVCLNTIVHRLRYTLTVAVCTRVPRKATCCNFYDGPREFESADGRGDCEYDLQLLSRHVHVSKNCPARGFLCFRFLIHFFPPLLIFRVFGSMFKRADSIRVDQRPTYGRGQGT